MLYDYKSFINESVKKTFLGYHSSKSNIEGLNKGDILDVDDYKDIIRNAYLELIAEQDISIEKMNLYFKKNKYGFTFVSDTILNAPSFQYSKYKYGDYLYEAYGDGSEHLLDDVNELNATIVVSKSPLYFKKIRE